MKKFNKGFASILFFAALSAWSKGTIDLVNEAFVEKEETQKDGSKVKKLVPAAKVVPGEEVIYVITYKNVGKEAATDIVITNPIPKHMTYRNAENDGQSVAEVSVDGGKKWGDLAALKVQDKLRKTRPALPADVTSVRWKVAGAIQPNQTGIVRLRTVLN